MSEEGGPVGGTRAGPGEERALSEREGSQRERALREREGSQVTPSGFVAVGVDSMPPPAPELGGAARWHRGARFWPRPTLRLRLTLLYGGLLVVVGLTLLGTAAVVLDRTIQHIPQFPPGQRLVLQDSAGRKMTVASGDYTELVRDQARAELLKAGALAFGAVVLVGVAAGFVLAGQALQPVSQLTATARRLSTETLDQRIALDGPGDELKELADTFDDMLGRLDAAFDSQRRFVANASHELRTPLAVIRTEVDVTLGDPGAGVADLRTMGEVVRDASERADRLVDALLVLARSEAQARVGLELHEPVDLAVLAEAAVDRLAGEARRRCLEVTATTRPAPANGDPELLDRLVGNLVENAVQHNVDGGWVTVRTGTGTHAGRRVTILTVANGGPVLASDAVGELFEPFRRGGTARTASRGAGLGLSIVRAVSAAHGGEVSAVPWPDGGLEVTVRLPAPGRARGV
jgi:signal transduction histidine kinase